LHSDDTDCLFFTSTEDALNGLEAHTDHVFVSGGGEIYKAMSPLVSTVHLSRIHIEVRGDVYFPELPASLKKVFEQSYRSNLDYTYQIWQK